jgi:manganese/zinc/iron transport system ATP- binding protein
MNEACKVGHLTVAYGEQLVLKDVSVVIPRGVICAVVGPNGAGKTTFIKAILGLVDRIAGTIDMATESVSYVPQRRTIDWDFPITVLDVVLMGRYKALGWFTRVTENDRILALHALRQVKLLEYADRPISQLSGGERQRIFLARSLVQDADLYIMDEPFVGVDAVTEQTIVEVLKSLRAQGKTIIIVHHDLQTMQEYFDWLVLLNVQLVAAGPMQEVFTKKNIEQAYGALPRFLAIME